MGEINEYLTCKYLNCNKYYKLPIRLPCENSMCKEHLDQFIKNDSNGLVKFKCYFCSKQHNMLKEFIPPNQDILNVLKMNLHLNDKQKEAYELIKNYKLSLENLAKIINDPDDFLFEYFSTIRNKIDIEREHLMQKINLISKDMLSKLDAAERECLEHKEKFKNLLSGTLKNELEKIDEEMKARQEELRMSNLNQDCLNDILINIKFNSKKSIETVLKVNNEILNYTKCSFMRNTTQLSNDQLFGTLKIEKASIDTYLDHKASCIDFNLIKKIDFNMNFVLCIEAIDENTMACSFSDNSIGIIDIMSGNCMHKLFGHENFVHCLVKKHSNYTLISGSRDWNIKIWDLKTTQCIFTLTGHQAQVRILSLSDNEKKLISESDDRTIKIWDLESLKCIQTLCFGNDFPIASSLLIISNNILVAGLTNFEIKTWDIEKFTCLKILKGHVDKINCLESIIGSNYLASCSNDCTIKYWDLFTGCCIKTFNADSPILCMKTISQGFFISGHKGKKMNLRLWDIKQNDYIRSIEAHESSVEKMKLVGGCSVLATSSFDKCVKLWQLDNLN